jgi:hypothetical protein
VAIADRDTLSTVHANIIGAITDFIRAIIALPAVRRVDTSQGLGQAHWWIFVDDDSDEVLDQIYSAEFRLRKAISSVPIDVRVLNAGAVDRSALPQAATLFDR